MKIEHTQLMASSTTAALKAAPEGADKTAAAAAPKVRPEEQLAARWRLTAITRPEPVDGRGGFIRSRVCFRQINTRPACRRERQNIAAAASIDKLGGSGDADGCR